jgi:hypothetical protein
MQKKQEKIRKNPEKKSEKWKNPNIVWGLPNMVKVVNWVEKFDKNGKQNCQKIAKILIWVGIAQ